jgi:hypothetical protein
MYGANRARAYSCIEEYSVLYGTYATPFCLVLRGWIRGVEWIPPAVAVRMVITVCDPPPVTKTLQFPILPALVYRSGFVLPDILTPLR